MLNIPPSSDFLSWGILPNMLEMEHLKNRFVDDQPTLNEMNTTDIRIGFPFLGKRSLLRSGVLWEKIITVSAVPRSLRRKELEGQITHFLFRSSLLDTGGFLFSGHAI